MWNILKNSEIIKFFLEAKFSCTEYSPDLFQIMAKKDNDRNFNTSSVKPSETKWFELIHSNMKDPFQKCEH